MSWRRRSENHLETYEENIHRGLQWENQIHKEKKVLKFEVPHRVLRQVRQYALSPYSAGLIFQFKHIRIGFFLGSNFLS